MATDTPPQHPDPKEDPYSVTQASRIYFLPNLMTAGNLFCGFMSVISCIHARLAESALTYTYNGIGPFGHYRHAVYFILGAAIFDSLDGRLARMGGRESLFGAEFDSLADVISFGIAPAMMMFFFILSPTQHPEAQWFRSIGWAVGFIYLLCAAMRLARFNVITNPLIHRKAKDSNKDFLGLPVPSAAATVAATLLCLMKLIETNRTLKSGVYALPFLMLIVAFLMMSTIRFPSGKNLGMQTKVRARFLVFGVVALGLIVYFKEYALLGICVAYLLFGILRSIFRRLFGPKTPPGTTTPFPKNV